MSTYLKLGGRFLILCTLVTTLVLSKPMPSHAFTCTTQCQAQCSDDYRACLGDCPGCEGQQEMCFDILQGCWQSCGC